MGCYRPREVVAHSDRGTLSHQHERCGLSDDLRVTDHHYLEPVKVQACLLDEFNRRRSRAWREGEIVVNDVADGRRVHPLEILERVYGRGERANVDMPRHLSLKYHACLLYTSDAADERSSVDLG